MDWMCAISFSRSAAGECKFCCAVHGGSAVDVVVVSCVDVDVSNVDVDVTKVVVDTVVLVVGSMVVVVVTIGSGGPHHEQTAAARKPQS